MARPRLREAIRLTAIASFSFLKAVERSLHVRTENSLSIILRVSFPRNTSSQHVSPLVMGGPKMSAINDLQLAIVEAARLRECALVAAARAAEEFRCAEHELTRLEQQMSLLEFLQGLN